MLDSTETVLADQIKDLYSAENQLVKALPKVAKAVSSESLHDAIAAHLEETRTHVNRLEQIAQGLGIRPRGKVCKAMKGLIAEGTEAMKSKGSDAGRDSAIIAAAQRIEHYEISAYGTARALAESMEAPAVAALLAATLDEERSADRLLTAISVGEVLPELKFRKAVA